MATQRRFWLTIGGALLAFVLIACSCSSLIPKSLIGGRASGEPIQGLAGKWQDPDTVGPTYHVIAWQNSEYVVTETRNPERGGNEVTSSNWDGTTLTWTYCVPDGACVTTSTVSLNGNELDTTWSNDQGDSGSTIMTRMNP